MQGQDSRVHNRVVRNGVPTPRAAIAVRPFRSAEEAWLWTMAALQARRDGARYTANRGLVSRPCEPDDVIRCLDALYRRRRIDLAAFRRSLGPLSSRAGMLEGTDLLHIVNHRMSCSRVQHL